jgi:hypothetical protein
MRGRTARIVDELLTRENEIDLCEKGKIEVDFAGSNINFFIGQRKRATLTSEENYERIDLSGTH